MFKKLQTWLGGSPSADTARPLPSVPEGERYYVVGDVHGRDDLFEALRDAIEDDDASSAPAQTSIILLGDLIDRGPGSARVVALAHQWQLKRPVRCLAGNHEEMFLESFEDSGMLRHFIKHGGRETLLSYGMSRETLRDTTIEELQDAMRDLVPQVDRDFLQGFEEMIVAGDYVFVHAGIDPKLALDEQKRSDLLWIRERFLRHDEPLDYMVVHGHTISDDVAEGAHRIGIDTGAFRSGVLTALVLEGTSRRTIQTVETDGEITVRRD